MTGQNFQPLPIPLQIVLYVALLAAVNGCVIHQDRPAQGSIYEDNSAVFLVQDDYVYYPGYQCYYSASRHQYAYREGNVWVGRPAPHGVPVNVLRASPSVNMNFHDSPANHHAAVVQQYPKDWKPAAANQDPKQKKNPTDGNNGR